MRGRILPWALAAACLAALPRPAAGAEPTTGYLTIQTAFLREDFSRVTALSQDFILEHPEAPEVSRVWLWLALSLDRLRQPVDGLRELDRLKQRLRPTDPLWAEVLYWDGEISRRALQFSRARTAYRLVTDRYPKSAWATQAQLGLGLIDLQYAEYASALSRFQQVSAAAEGGSSTAVIDARLYAGLCLIQLQRDVEAVQALLPLMDQLQDSGQVADAAFYLAEAFHHLKRFQDAARAYRQSLDASPASRWAGAAQFGLGWALFRAGACAEALPVLKDYTKRRDSDHQPEALFAEGRCLLEAGRESEALSRFESVVSRAPGHPVALESALLLSEAYRRQGRLVLAKEVLHGCLHRPLANEDMVRVQLRLAAIAMEQGNAAQAKTIYRAAADQPDPALRRSALNGLGEVHLYLGEVPEAKQRFEEAAALQPVGPETAYATYQLARIQLEAGEFEPAMAALDALSADPAAPLADDARLALIIALLNTGRQEEARGRLTAMRDGGNAALAARAAYYGALIALGNDGEAEAERLCLEAISHAPGTDEALEARLLVAELHGRRTSPARAAEELAAWYRHPMPRAQRGKLAKRLGDLARADGAYAEAIRWYTDAMAWLPAFSGEAVYWIASCYETGGDFELAVQWYQHVEQAPWQTRGQLAAAKVLERQDQIPEARAIYARLAQARIPEASLVRERLAALDKDMQQKER